MPTYPVYRPRLHTLTYRRFRNKEPQIMTYNIDRFLGRADDHADPKRPPVAFMQVRDQATAEAEEIASMRARLDAFDKQFGSGANHSRS